MPLSAYEQQQLRAKFGDDAIVHFDGAHAFLSNFTAAPCVPDGVTYKTAEHAFQAQKTTDIGMRARIAAASSATQAKRLGRQVAGGPNMTPGWFSGGRDEAMRTALAAKARAPARSPRPPPL